MDNLISLVLVCPEANCGCGGLPASHLVLASPPFFPCLTPILPIRSQEPPWPDSADMEGAAGNAPCEHFEANVCQNCFHPEAAHRARHQVGQLSRVVKGGLGWGV